MPSKDVRGKGARAGLARSGPRPTVLPPLPGHHGSFGRTTKLTPQLQERVCTLISDGNYIETACQAVGIVPVTIREWIARGELGEEPFDSFAAAVKEAHAQAETKLLGIIKTAAVDTWQAAAWILERTRPDRYARRWVPGETVTAIKFSLALWEEKPGPGAVVEVESRVVEEAETEDYVK